MMNYDDDDDDNNDDDDDDEHAHLSITDDVDYSYSVSSAGRYTALLPTAVLSVCPSVCLPHS